jgi:signal transduction histidine kinase
LSIDSRFSGIVPPGAGVLPPRANPSTARKTCKPASLPPAPSQERFLHHPFIVTHAASISHTELALRIRESGSSAAAFRVLLEPLRESAPLRGVWWVGRDGHEAWPEDSEPPADPGARAVMGEGIIAEEDLARGTETLVLALGGGLGGIVLCADRGALGDADAWERVRTALHAVADRERERADVEAERETLLRRAEESEALHVLGLAANRTLDPDEVLTLVARFTRTLLGAHYVTVSTREGTPDDARVRTMAAVGLRADPPVLDDDPFARRVIQAGNPLSIGGADGIAPGEYPFHAGEGMEAGLGVPLALFGDSFGALVIGYRRPYQPTPQDTRLALTLAGHAAVALSNARLHRALAARGEELAHALNDLRETSAAKERFFASMSHELRTPLNGILGYQSLVLDGLAGDLSPGARTFLQKADRAGRNLLRIVDDILDYAKIEAGKVQLTIAPAIARELAEDAAATLQPVADAKGVRLSIEKPPCAAVVHTDSARVRQVLVNLLSNAVKFTHAGGEVTVLAVEVEGDVEFRVRDTGPGIAPEDQQRIFQEFEQVPGTRGGTGLGLPISRKLARLLGGELTVHSRPGEGSTFSLRLPFAAPPPGTPIAG